MKAFHIFALASAFGTACAVTPSLSLLEDSEALAGADVYASVESRLMAGNYDGRPGNECVALLQPELRSKTLILTEPARADGTCSLELLQPGNRVTFPSAAARSVRRAADVAALRSATSAPGASVFVLTGSVARVSISEAEAATLESMSLVDQDTALRGTAYTRVRAHSRYDFNATQGAFAEAAYRDLFATGPCERPGVPRLEALVKDGFVFGYMATNAGSCYSATFVKSRVYNRAWQRVGTRDFLEE